MITTLLDFLVISFFVGVVIVSTFTFSPVESAAIGNAATDPNTVVYQRFVRRRPVNSPDYNYVDEYVEVFNTQRKPPVIWMTDEELDKFLFCDFHSETEECKRYWNSRNSKGSKNPLSTEKPSTVRSTMKPSFTIPQVTTTRKEFTTTTTNRPLVVKTTDDVKMTTTTTTEAPTTEYWGRIPDIVEGDYDDNGTMGNDEYVDTEDFTDKEDYTDQTFYRSSFSSLFS